MGTRGNHHDPRYGSGGGEFGLSYHLEMLADSERVRRCMAAIEAHADPERTFCELGAGTGVFSVFAAKRFKQVITVERDTKMLAIIRDTIQRSELENICVLHADALECITPSFLSSVDVLFCEMMSTWLIVEPQVLVMNRVRACCGEREISTIPAKVHNLLEVGNCDYEMMGVSLRCAIPQFTGNHAPRILSTSVVASILDFGKVNEELASSAVKVRILAGGVANCLRLSSIVNLAPRVSFYSTDTLMPPLIVPLERSLEVAEGDLVRVDFKYAYRSPVEAAHFVATVVG